MRGKMKKRYSRIVAVLLAVSILILMFPAQALAAGELDGPVFSSQGGFYSEDFQLTLSADSGTQIRYTTDGSAPTMSSNQYTTPFTVSAPSLNESPMTAGVNVGARNYMNARVIRAAAFSADGTQSSKIITHTYFIDPDIDTKFSMPVLAMTFEPDDFADRVTGMYSNWGNKDLTPQAFIQLYSADGELQFQQSAQMKVSGHGSRGDAKKSLRMNFSKGEYEDNSGPLVFDLFDGVTQNYYSLEPVTSHAKITCRTTDWTSSTFQETLTYSIAKRLRPDTMAAVPSAVFVNGEFWGVYETREQADNNFIAQHYTGIKKSQVVALAFDWDTANAGYDYREPLYRVSYDEGPDGGEETYYASYMDFYNASTVADLTIPENFEKLKEYVDVDNLIDYFLVYMFADNDDWPGNNVKMWRTVDSNSSVYGHDGKWRFIIHDFDIAFDNAWRDRMHSYTTAKSDNDPRQPEWAVAMYRNLFTSEEFRNLMAARYSTYTATAFSADETLRKLDELVEARENDLGKDFYRWNLHGGDLTGSVNNWRNGTINNLRNYLTYRPEQVLNHIRDYYNNNFQLGIPTQYANVSFETDASQGWLDISGAEIRPEVYGEEMASGWTAKYSKTLPISITANALDGSRLSYLEISGNNALPEKAETQKYVLTPGAESANIVVKAVYADVTALELLYTIHQGKDQSLYTTATWAVFAEALANAGTTLAKGVVSQEEVNAVWTALNEGANQLVYVSVEPGETNKAILKGTIDYAQRQDLTDLNVIVERNFQKALDNAIIVYDNPTATQDEIDEAAEALLKMIHMLSFTSDPSALLGLVEAAEDINANLDAYKETGKQEFIDALNNAYTVLEDERSLDADYQEAYDRLLAAMDALEEKDADTTQLEKMIARGEQIVTDKEKYLGVGWEEFLQALEAAKNALTSDDQAVIDNATMALYEAILDLRLKPNKDLLGSLLNRAYGVNAALYTLDSAEAVKKAAEAGRIVFENPEATQQEVTKAAKDVKNALDDLVSVDAEKSAANGASGNIQPTDPGRGNNAEAVTAIPKTGDEQAMALSLVLIAICGIAMAIGRKRNK